MRWGKDTAFRGYIATFVSISQRYLLLTCESPDAEVLPQVREGGDATVMSVASGSGLAAQKGRDVQIVQLRITRPLLSVRFAGSRARR